MNTTPIILQEYQRKFIDFLLAAKVLSFGDFTLKSGRKAPYFVNTGNINDGPKIAALGEFYASHIAAQGWNSVDVIFGPAYKGIPLCVGTSIALSAQYGRGVGFTFDRKEAKDHGDGGLFVGTPLQKGTKVVIVEDVVTAGTTLQKVVPLLRSLASVEIVGVVVAVDRCEKGLHGELSAVKEAESSLGIKVAPVVTIHHILSHLTSPSAGAYLLGEDQKERAYAYLAQYGA